MLLLVRLLLRLAGLALLLLAWRALALHVRRELRTAHAVGIEWGAHGWLHGSGNRLCLRRFIYIGIVVVGWGGVDSGECTAGRARAEDQLPWGSLAKVADHNHVVASAIEELGENVARRAGTIITVNTRIGGEAVDMSAGEGGDFSENLRQARIGGFDAQALAVPNNPCGLGVIVCRPMGQFGRGRDESLGCGGVRSRWSLRWFGNRVQVAAGLAKGRCGMGVGLNG